MAQLPDFADRVLGEHRDAHARSLLGCLWLLLPVSESSWLLRRDAPGQQSLGQQSLMSFKELTAWHQGRAARMPAPPPLTPSTGALTRP